MPPLTALRIVAPRSNRRASPPWGIGLRWRATRAPRRTRAGRRAGAAQRRPVARPDHLLLVLEGAHAINARHDWSQSFGSASTRPSITLTGAPSKSVLTLKRSGAPSMENRKRAAHRVVGVSCADPV